MEIREFNNFKDAFQSLMPESRECVFVRHSLEPKEEIKLHYHPKANEWLVINRGRFVVTLESEEQEFWLKRRVMAIRFSAKQKHALATKSKISFFVLRDRADKTIYMEKEEEAN